MIGDRPASRPEIAKSRAVLLFGAVLFLSPPLAGCLTSVEPPAPNPPPIPFNLTYAPPSLTPPPRPTDVCPPFYGPPGSSPYPLLTTTPSWTNGSVTYLVLGVCGFTDLPAADLFYRVSSPVGDTYMDSFAGVSDPQAGTRVAFYLIDSNGDGWVGPGDAFRLVVWPAASALHLGGGRVRATINGQTESIFVIPWVGPPKIELLLRSQNETSWTFGVARLDNLPTLAFSNLQTGVHPNGTGSWLYFKTTVPPSSPWRASVGYLDADGNGALNVGDTITVSVEPSGMADARGGYVELFFQAETMGKADLDP